MALNEVIRFLLFFLPIFATLVRAQSPEYDGYFTTPPPYGSDNDYKDNKVYHVGDQVEMSWVLDLNKFSCLLWQENATNSSAELSASIFDGLENAQSYTWTVSLSYAGGPTFEVNNDSAVPSNIFHFAIYNYTATSYAIRSHSFNITAAPNNTSPSTTTTGASSPTHSAGSDVQDPNATISPSASATSSPAPGGGGGGSGLSTGAQAGIGVGVGIAGLAAIAALVWFFRFRNRTPSATPAERQPMYVEQKPPFAEGPPNQGTEVNKYDGNYIGELPTDRGAEMPAGNFHQPSHELPGN